MAASGQGVQLPQKGAREGDDDSVVDSEDEAEGEEVAVGEALAGCVGGAGFGGVTVSRSREVRVGPATFYNAPIHIHHLSLAEQPQPQPQPQPLALPLHHTPSALCPWLASPGGAPWRLLLTVASAVAAAATVAILIVVLRRTTDHTALPARPPQNKSGNLTVIAESEWSTQTLHDRRISLRLPVHYVIVSHTFSEECAVYAECVRLLRDLQRLHVSARGYYDIAYNFIVGGDGYVYEGRGWGYRAERQAAFADNSVTLSLAGRFTQGLRPPSDLQMAALQALLQEGVRAGALSPRYRLFALCQVEYNSSPGSLAYQRVKQLPNWSLYSGATHAGNCTS